MQGKKKTITLLNIAYTPKWDSNLILFGQLRKLKISYYDRPDSMIFRKKGSTLGIANRYKNLFVLETSQKVILVRGKGCSTHFFSPKPHIRLWHHCLSHASNTRVMQASKLADGIDLGGEISADDGAHLSDSKPDKKNAENKPTSINKAIDSSETTKQLCETCVQSKHTRIIKTKNMTSTTRKLQEVHIDL